MTTLSDKIRDIIIEHAEGMETPLEGEKIDVDVFLDEIMETVKDEVYSALGHTII